MLIYFLKGKLPWQGLKGKTKTDRRRKIKYTKINTSLTDLCNDIPEQFYRYMCLCIVKTILELDV